LRQRDDVAEADVDGAGNDAGGDGRTVGAGFEGNVEPGGLEEALVQREIGFGARVDRKGYDPQGHVLRAGLPCGQQRAGPGGDGTQRAMASNDHVALFCGDLRRALSTSR